MKAPRFLGVSAIAGGVLRIAEPYLAATLDPSGLQVAYVLTDIALILGLLGFYLAFRDRLSAIGIGGIALALVGLTVIRVGDALGYHIYQLGAAITLFGTAFLGVDMLMRKISSPIAAALWLIALVVGLAALAPQITMPAALAAGIAFALAFIAEGAVLLS